MPLMRTATIELDVAKTTDFDLDVEICKAQEVSGRRFLTGVASGVLEDADGERVSKRAIAAMSQQAVRGLKLVAGSHAQDWHNEIGDAVDIRHDPDHDELLVKCELPPEGEDPLADKAWLRQTKYGEKLGFSIGGKLTKTYFELTETGKKRKVLDGITLKHFALTKKPAYRQSFALAVAKTAADLEPPADDAFTIEAEPEDDAPIVAKMDGWTDPDVAKAGDASAVSQDVERGNVGTQGDDTKRPDVNNDDDGDKDKDTPPAGTGERHLACPNCGHEFAAAMPADKDTPADAAGDTTTGKRAAGPEEEGDMPLDKTLANLRKLAGTADDAEVAKTEEEKTAEGAAASTDEPTDVEKLIAASHEAGQESLDTLRSDVTEGFGVVEKAVKGLYDLIANLPAGRQSIARVQKQAGQGAATRAEVEAGGEVGKVATEDVTDADIEKVAETDPVKALALHNLKHSGIESNIAGRATGAGELKPPRWDD